jgi:hypothetical protein
MSRLITLTTLTSGLALTLNAASAQNRPSDEQIRTAFTQSLSVTERQCIFLAADRLPKIPGLTIVASRARPHPDVKAPKGAVSIAVEIDVNAGGHDGTFAWFCGSPPGGDSLKLTSDGLIR